MVNCLFKDNMNSQSKKRRANIRKPPPLSFATNRT